MDKSYRLALIVLCVLIACVFGYLFWFTPSTREVQAPDVTDACHGREPGKPIGAPSQGESPKPTPEETDKPAPEPWFVDVSLLMPDGVIAPRGVITWTDSGKAASVQFSPPVTRITVAGDRCLLSATGPGEAFRSGEVEVARGSGPVELQLEGGVELSGRLSFPNLYVDPHAFVYLQPSPADEDWTNVNVTKLRKEIASDTLDFTFEDVPPGEYRLIVESIGRLVAAHTFRVEYEPVFVEIAVPEIRPEECIVIRAFGPDESPVAITRVSMQVSTSTSALYVNPRLLRPGDGVVWILRTNSAEWLDHVEGDWHYEFIVYFDGYERRNVRYEPTDTHEVVIRFDPQAHLELTITNGDEHPLKKGMCWSLVAPGQPGLFDSEEPLREEFHPRHLPGLVKKGPIDAGEYDLVLILVSVPYDEREIYRERITLSAGMNLKTVSIPPLYSLKITLPDGDTTARLKLTRNAGVEDFAIWREVKDGALLVEHLAAGEYIVESELGRMTAVVPGEVVFRPVLYDCLEVGSMRDGGRIEQLGLRNGDRVIVIDGVDARDIPAVKAAAREARDKESTSWTVIRDGARIDVIFNGKELQAIIHSKEDPPERLKLTPTYRE